MHNVWKGCEKHQTLMVFGSPVHLKQKIKSKDNYNYSKCFHLYILGNSGSVEMPKIITEVFVTILAEMIYSGLLTVGRYPAWSWQSTMIAMCWPETRVYIGKVFIHPAEPEVLCVVRRVERITRE